MFLSSLSSCVLMTFLVSFRLHYYHFVYLLYVCVLWLSEGHVYYFIYQFVSVSFIYMNDIHTDDNLLLVNSKFKF